MTSFKWMLMICSLFSATNVFAVDPPIVGAAGNTVTFQAKKWTSPVVESTTAWFTANGKTFPLFHAGIGAQASPEWFSPDKKFLLATAVEYGVVIGENGEEIATSQGHCDVISMETGCVLAESYERFCEGKWVGNQWVSEEGGVLNPVLETKSPKDLLKNASSIEPAQSRAESLEWSLSFLSPESYMACHPPAQNVQAYNDLGFYLAEGGRDELALKFYRGVEAVGKRTVLMLNIADSLWRLDRKDEAQRYYSQYRDAMSADGKTQKIPQRVVERSVIQGMEN